MAVSRLKLVTFKLSAQTLARLEDLKAALAGNEPTLGWASTKLTRTDVLRHLVAKEYGIYIAKLDKESKEQQDREQAEVKAIIEKKKPRSHKKQATKKTKGKKS